MYFLYTLFLQIIWQLLRFAAIFNKKLQLFVDGRKNVFAQIAEKITLSDKTIWFHAASLGEYEQGLPVMEKTKQLFPNHKIVLTFFSPSGFEVRKNNIVADVTVYLPFDLEQNVKKFIKVVHPEMVFFIKYEFWPNYLKALKEKNIKTYLISGIFRENQLFFKPYGGFYRKSLQTFDCFFVQNESSKKLLQSIGFHNVVVSGDTRFDRVATILEQSNSLDFIEEFKNNKATIVIGSSWPKDEEFLVNYINQTSEDVKFIIAPHNIKEEEILELKNSITKKTILFSERQQDNLLPLADYTVFIIDTIGLLTKVYSYADIAYVGGGFGSGIHNILEPATYGVPVVIGPNFAKFAEAIALVNMGGCMVINNQNELNQTVDLLLQNEDERTEKGLICSTFVQMNKGATTTIMNKIGI